MTAHRFRAGDVVLHGLRGAEHLLMAVDEDYGYGEDGVALRLDKLTLVYAASDDVHRGVLRRALRVGEAARANLAALEGGDS